MASTIVSRTQSGSESAAGRKTWTFSCWFKKNEIISGGSNQELFGSDSNGARSNNYNIIDLNSSDQIDFSGYQSGTTFRKITNRRFRDTNAWYHLVIAFDTTQSTADDRIKIYINGVRETSFGTSTNPAQDHQGKFFAQNKVHAFGRSSQTFDGLISHVHATEGTAYAPTVFGSTDSTTGEWKINTAPSVSYGTNGFFLFKDDNSVNNQAGNSSGNFAVTAGTLTKTEDNPSNIFATLNPLNGVYYAGLGFLNGNTSITTTAGNYAPGLSTLGVNSGKWYAEFKMTSSSNWAMVGVTGQVANATNYSIGHGTTGYAYAGGSSSTGQQSNDNNLTAYGSAYNNGDIIGIALDLDNHKLYFHKNGTYQNSGVPTSGSTGTGAISISTSPDTGFYHMGVGNYSGSQTPSWSANFGNGFFGTTAVSSAGTNASNLGIFEYDVPSGYTALCTKGLNE